MTTDHELVSDLGFELAPAGEADRAQALEARFRRSVGQGCAGDLAAGGFSIHHVLQDPAEIVAPNAELEQLIASRNGGAEVLFPDGPRVQVLSAFRGSDDRE